MLTRNQIKFISSLSRKAQRTAEQKFVVEGVKLCEELLGSGFAIEMLYVQQGLDIEIDGEVPITYISEKDLLRISQLKTPNKMLAVVHMPAADETPDLHQGTYLFLDRINDPGNLGTIIRMADWFGIERVFCTHQSVDAFSSKVIQSSMGSVFRIPVHYVDGAPFLASYRADFPLHAIWSAEMEGQALHEVNFESNGLIVMGSESHGVHPDYAPYITQKVTIPAFGNAESLNVGVATGVVLWEMMRGN